MMDQFGGQSSTPATCTTSSFVNRRLDMRDSHTIQQTCSRGSHALLDIARRTLDRNIHPSTPFLLLNPALHSRTCLIYQPNDPVPTECMPALRQYERLPVPFLRESFEGDGALVWHTCHTVALRPCTDTSRDEHVSAHGTRFCGRL